MLEAVPYSTVNMLLAWEICEPTRVVSLNLGGECLRLERWGHTGWQNERDTRGTGTSRLRKHVEQLSVAPDLVRSVL